ncbi:NUDIX hydrolase [Mangrovibacterium marinum]|nr:NUDIX domain-containing protein [Mangrovibacterium marinum]
MYKVFFNECLILLQPENKNLRSGNIEQVIDIERVSSFMALLESLDGAKCVEEPVFNCLIKSELIEAVISSMVQLPAAGGLVRNPAGEILFIKRFGRWDLPKGKIEKGERVEDAAVREVEEECGIRQLKLVKQLPSTFHIYRSPYLAGPDNWVWKETSWFEMRYDGGETLVPQTEEDITEVAWFAPDALAPVYASTYGNLKLLLGDYFA